MKSSKTCYTLLLICHLLIISSSTTHTLGCRHCHKRPVTNHHQPKTKHSPPHTSPIIHLPPISLPPILKPPTTPSSKPCPPPPPVPSPPSRSGPSPTKTTCPIDTLKLGACVDVLGGLVHIGLGDPAVNECCPILYGLVDLEAAVCLCSTLKLKALNIKIYVPLALQLLVACGKTPPPGYSCSF